MSAEPVEVLVLLLADVVRFELATVGAEMVEVSMA
jgi:hypothetical protein